MAKTITKELLLSKGLRVEKQDGKDVILKKDGTPYNLYPLTTKHRYGDDKTYYAISLYYDGKSHNLLVHRVIYAWYNGICEKDMDINHIDDDSSNNNIENLEAIPHSENIKKKKRVGNQYTRYTNWEAIQEAMDESYVAQQKYDEAKRRYEEAYKNYLENNNLQTRALWKKCVKEKKLAKSERDYKYAFWKNLKEINKR